MAAGSRQKAAAAQAEGRSRKQKANGRMQKVKS